MFADRTAVVDGDVRLTYAELADRCARLVSALARAGVGEGDRVAALCANSHVMLELHNAVPMRGAVLVSINIRLSPSEMAYIVEHSGAHAPGGDPGVRRGCAAPSPTSRHPLVLEDEEYDAWLAEPADPADRWTVDERSLLAHQLHERDDRQAQGRDVPPPRRDLQADGDGVPRAARTGGALPVDAADVPLQRLVLHLGGHRGRRHARVPARGRHRARSGGCCATEGITHFSAAPTVLTMIAEDPAAGPLERRVHVDTGGAPPSPALLARLDPLGFDVTHLYGLTETFGPIAINEWQPEWDELDADARSRLRARQGVGNLIAQPLRVLDADGNDVPADGETIGELAARGNDVMLGYYRDEEATAAVTRSGCFLTGDLGVMHPDGYVEIRDRSKDVIISGGENIASVEVEQVLDSHPAVVESAVVGGAGRALGRGAGRVRDRARRATSSTRTSSRRTSASGWRTSRCRTGTSWASCRGRRPGRSGRTCCASAPARSEGQTSVTRRPEWAL